MTPWEVLGRTNYLPNQGPTVIVMNTSIQRHSALAELTLLHEMAHVKVDYRYPPHMRGHGHEWQSEMLRLAKAGAFRDRW
jgi:predicted SprT family Zn-dependent metalloprotease